MYDIFQLANWFLKKEPMTHKKLQKLCYYTQAWSYALRDEPFVDSDFQAWAHGPVSPVLYEKYAHSGLTLLHPSGNADTAFPAEDEDFLESIWVTYGRHSGNTLEALSHTDPPWILARNGCDARAFCENVIDPKEMRIFYRSVYTEDLETNV